MPMKLSLSQSVDQRFPLKCWSYLSSQTSPLSPSVFGGAFTYFGTIL